MIAYRECRESQVVDVVVVENEEIGFQLLLAYGKCRKLIVRHVTKSCESTKQDQVSPKLPWRNAIVLFT